MAALLLILISSTLLASLCFGTSRQTMTFLGFALAGIITFLIANSLVVSSSVIFWGSISSICSYIALWVVGQNSKTLQMTIYLGLALATTTTNLLGLGFIQPLLTFTFILVSNYGMSNLKVISEDISGILGSDPGELELNKETEGLSVLDKVETKTLYNWFISSFFAIFAGLMIFNTSITQYRSFASDLSIGVSPVLAIATWGFYLYETKTKLSFLLGAILSGLILFLSIYSFGVSSGVGSMGVMMALSFLYESINGNVNTSESKIIRKVIKVDEVRYSLSFRDPSNDNNLSSLALMGGLASSFFIGLPSYLYNITFIAPYAPNSKDRLGFFWLSDIISEHFGLFIFFIWGISRTGLSDALSQFEFTMNPNIALGILFVCLVLNFFTYLYRRDILEIYSWILLDVDLLKQNAWVSKAKFSVIPFMLASTVTPFLVFTFVALAFLTPRMFAQYKFPSVSIMLPFSLSPIYNLAVDLWI